MGRGFWRTKGLLLDGFRRAPDCDATRTKALPRQDGTRWYGTLRGGRGLAHNRHILRQVTIPFQGARRPGCCWKGAARRAVMKSSGAVQARALVSRRGHCLRERGKAWAGRFQGGGNSWGERDFVGGVRLPGAPGANRPFAPSCTTLTPQLGVPVDKGFSTGGTSLTERAGCRAPSGKVAGGHHRHPGGTRRTGGPPGRFVRDGRTLIRVSTGALRRRNCRIQGFEKPGRRADAPQKARGLAPAGAGPGGLWAGRCSPPIAAHRPVPPERGGGVHLYRGARPEALKVFRQFLKRLFHEAHLTGHRRRTASAVRVCDGQVLRLRQTR